ncbi:hypothetical protein PC39_14327 [Salinisphaera sp. PC39]|uniref:YnfA family protein n=1 Tax=Salinisphaera sp. PC39 TaxID=1304156 RepID=UPI00333F9B7F
MTRFYLMGMAVDAAAVLAEIAGCFAFWAWLRRGGSAWRLLLPGLASQALFAYLLTRVDVGFASRIHAACGGIFIAASLAWLWLAEGLCPNTWDLAGAGLAVPGTLVILASAQVSR